jgi:hypothetical protein
VRVADWVTVQHHDPSGGFGIPRDLSDEALFIGPSGWLAHEHNGSLEGTWNASMSPIVITRDVWIDEDSLLVIEPGVEVLFLAGSSFGVYGRLQVSGAPADSVLFSSVETTPAPGDWGPLNVGWGAGKAVANLQFAIVEYGDGCTFEGPLRLNCCALRFNVDTAVRPIDPGRGSALLQDCVIEWNQGFGLSQVGARRCVIRKNGRGGIRDGGRADSCLVVDNNGPGIAGDFVTVTYSTVVGNRNTGIEIREGSNGIQHNRIHDNGDLDLHNDSPQEIDARYNDWGPITTAEMNAGGNPKDITRIYDVYDNPADGFVNYSEWVTEVGVLITDARAELTSTGVRVQWSLADANDLFVQVQRRTAATAWALRAHAGPVSGDALAFDDTDVVPGERYGYRLVIDEPGTAHVGGEVWVQVPAASLAIHGITPNPGSGASVVTFSLAESTPARLAVYDVRGRLVKTTELRAIGPGVHSVPLAGGVAIPHGVYFAKLSQGRASVATRFVLGR